MSPRSTLPSGHQSYMLLRCPLFGSFCSGMLTTVLALVGVVGLQCSWLPGPALHRGYQPLVGAAEPRGCNMGARWSWCWPTRGQIWF